MRNDTYPLLQAQLGVFLDCQRASDSTQYNIPIVTPLDGRVDLNRLERALGHVVNRRPVLRTRFSVEDGEARQWADPAMTIPVERVRLSDEQVETYVRETFTRPFDLTGGEPLARFAIVETEIRPYLLVDIHHVIMDGSAVLGQFLVRDLPAAYAGQELTVPSYGIFEAAVEEAASFATPRYAEDRDFQRALMSGRTFSSFSDAPAGERPSPVFQATERLSRVSCDDWCAERHVRPSQLFEAAFALVLARFTRTESVAYALEWHARTDARVRTAYGMFVRPLPIVADVSGTVTVRELMDRCRSTFAEVRSHATYPFTHLCADAGLVPGDTFNFIASSQFDVSLTLDGVCYLSERPLSRKSQEGVHCDIALAGADYEIRILSCVDRNSPESLRRIARAIRATAENMMAQPEACLSRISTVDASETADLLSLGMGEKRAYDVSETFLDLFLKHARATPEAKAVVAANGTFTYGELDAASSALATKLIEKGVKPGDFVAVKLPRIKEFPLAVIAIWKAGGAYVPVDPEYPEGRIAYMLEDSGAKVVVDEAFLSEVKSKSEKGKSAELSYSKTFSLFTFPFHLARPDGLAYMIYTSGSTGKPKGVMVSHANLRAFLAWLPDELELKPGEAVAEHASFSFDASICDLYTSLSRGVTLHILSSELRKDLDGLAKYLADNKIVGATLSTQLGMELLNSCDLKLRYMVLGGEKLKHVKKTSVRLYNGYGPTEFTCWSSHHVVDQANDGEDIPIGKAVPNTLSAIVDKSGNLLPRGMIGELVLAGAQLSRGYWHRPELTKEKFVALPWMKNEKIGGENRWTAVGSISNNQQPTTTNQLAYLTGDLARWDEKGELIYCGRIDNQVKLRGFRIEMGEIESAMAKFPGISAAVADVKKVNGVDRLVGYYVEQVKVEGGGTSLRDFLSKSLTDYMVPDAFVRLEKIPLTPNGKVDRKALPVPELADEPVVEPANELEAKILAALRDVLKTDRIGVTHDFARAGLNSLGAMSLAAKLKKNCGLAVTLAELAKAATVRRLAEAVGGSDHRAGRRGRRSLPESESARKRTHYPMTENQRGIYVDWLKNPATTQYNVPVAFRFPGLDPEALAAAAAKVVDAHPALKARFVEKNGEIVQERRDAATVAIMRETLDAEPDDAFFASRMRPFAPQGEDLVRLAVFDAHGVAYLFLDAHHTVFDGFSMGVFLRDLFAALDGRELAGEESTLFDAGLDDRDYLESELVAEDDAWFAKYLDGCESTALESSEPPAPGVASGTAGRAVAHVPARALNRRAGELGVSASDWFLTAFMELLRRIGRSDDVQILFVSAGRGNADYAESVGMFVRTLPVRNIKDEATFSATVKRLHADILALRDRDRASYARLAEKNGLKPEIIFAYEGGLFDLPRGATLIAPPTTTAKFPLSVTVTPGKDDFELCFEYDASRYGAHEMELLVGLFAHLAEGAIAEDALRAIPLLDDAAAAEAERMAYGGDLDYDATETFVDLFRAVVRAHPSATAVVDSKGAISYGELEAASDAFAAELAEKGVKPGDFVAVKLGRVKEFVVAAIGIMKAGAAYVPVDPEYPADRIAYMVEDSGAKVVVDEEMVQGSKFKVQGSRFKVQSSKLKVQGCGDGRHETRDAKETLNPQPSTRNPQPLAYMIYTSGSTGKPKGVAVPHRALRHLIEWTRRDRGITSSSRIVEHASFSFDASVIDIFPVLAAGGELHIFAEELRKDLPAMRDYIVKNGITGGSMSTQIGMALVDTYPDLPLHDIMFGGEKLLPVAKTDMMLMNGYGPTEFCVCSSYQIVDQNEKGDIPIGRAVPGTWSYVVDRYGHLLPQGLAGEIALAGPQIADGYWHQPEKTKARFVATNSQQPTTNNQRAYLTGDLARYDSRGRLQYLGRIDFQVKLRGFRIEMGEIEHAMAKFPGIASAVAEVRKVNGVDRLVGYYVGTVKGEGVGASLRDFLSKSLTDYMVPDYFVRLDEMPLTPNGKVNRKALPAPTGVAAGREYVAPQEGAEKTIAGAWGALLKIERFGATDDFFASGGTSLLGIKAVVALQKAGLDVQYGDLFKHKTPRALAAFLSNEASPSQTSQTPQAPQTFSSPSYAAIDALLAKTRTDLFGDFRVQPLGKVLLTGATGYLGIHILKYLLEHTASDVTVLLRSKGKAGPERRLDAQYVYYFGERLPDRFRSRLSYIEGDITSQAPQTSQPPPSTVINCAALVKHYSADDALDRVNVKGVENLLAWCEATGARFVQTSTYSIGGLVDAASPARLDERHLFVGQDSDNDYIRTKFLAERAVLAAVAAGKVRAKIMRLGNLMGREADGEFQMNVGANAFVNSLKSYVAIGAYPLDELATPLEMSPIDRVAEAVCLLATTPDDLVVFHPYNAYALDMGAVLGALNRRGHAIDYTSRAEFAARVDALKADPSRAAELQGILHYAQRHLDGRKTTPVSNAWTTTVLYRLGFRWKPAEDSYLASFIDMLDGLAVFG